MEPTASGRGGLGEARNTPIMYLSLVLRSSGLAQGAGWVLGSHTVIFRCLKDHEGGAANRPLWPKHLLPARDR